MCMANRSSGAPLAKLLALRDMASCRHAEGFVLGRYNCPQQIGNRVHVILNARLLSWLLGKQLVWAAEETWAPFECDAYLTREPRLRPLSHASGCAVSRAWVSGCNGAASGAA